MKKALIEAGAARERIIAVAVVTKFNETLVP